ncbi:ParA family partition ATPase [Paenirhodobacter populi]|uniref:ParA family protein n=1 Tax=Paenirhodobacter populi TaxID=2306993 RepID=A0A443JU71_9RHOB|nr:ParA family partition ATPase [Sinirhodobacter populi]RWR10731.1 ParA family protein [Sinirhodobacter populi]RWR24049.1 ParA family protein [Sinirhodobacter populi]
MTGRVITVAQQKGGAGKTTLAVNLATALLRQGRHVALLDTDPQGSLGRWFMTRRASLSDVGVDFSTSSAWGVSYEVEKLRRQVDVVIVDTPPKVDSDLRPALREADVILVPIAASLMDLWATEGVLDLARREGKRPKLVLNRVRGRTRLDAEVRAAAEALEGDLLPATLAHRVIYAETLGQGLGVVEARRSPAVAEVEALLLAVMAAAEASDAA